MNVNMYVDMDVWGKNEEERQDDASESLLARTSYEPGIR